MPTYGRVKVDTITYDLSGTATDVSVSNIATKASPTFTGTVTVPTPSANDNTTKAASTAYVQTELGDYALKAGPTFTGTINAASLVLSADLTVNGTTTTINTTTLQVEDKNIEIGKVSTPSDVTADGGGLTLLGATNKTWNWVNSTDAWTSSEHIHLGDNKKLLVGTGSDLSIYHDTNNSFISSITGNLKLVGNANILIEDNQGDTLASFNPNSSVDLYHNNVKKIETSATGCTVTGTLAATAVTGDGSGLTNIDAAPTFTATANLAITAEDAVIMQADGKVAKCFTHTTATGTQASIDTGSSNALISAYDKVSGKIAYVLRESSSLNVIVGTISGTTITFGSETQVSTESADNFGLAFYNNTLMVGYRRDGIMMARACTVSGTTITVGSETTIQATNVSGWGSTVVYDSTSDRWVIFYMTSTGGRYKVCSISGTTITQGTEGEAASTHYRGVKAIEAKSKGRILLAWLWNSGNTEGLMRVGQVNGGSTNTITWGAVTDISQEGGSEVMKKIAVGWDDKNDQGLFGFVRANNYCKVRAFEIDTSDNSIDQGSSTGAVTSDVTPYLDLVWNPDSNGWRIIFIKDGSGDQGKIQDKPCSISSSGLSCTIGNGEEYGPDLYSSGVFAQGGGRLAEYIGDSGILSAWRDHASGSASREYRIRRYGGGNLSTTEPFIGFAAGTVSDGQTCTVKVVGNTTTKSSLTPGRDYYVQSDGSISIGTSGTFRAGIAISSTSLLIKG